MKKVRLFLNSFVETVLSLPAFIQGLALILLVGVTVILNTALKVGCLAKAIFGVPCPVCGMTRAYLSLLRLDFSAAMHYNPAFWVFPFICLSGILAAADKKRTKPWLITFFSLIAVLLIIWIVRLSLGVTV
jgi:hypothetical protein